MYLSNFRLKEIILERQGAPQQIRSIKCLRIYTYSLAFPHCS